MTTADRVAAAVIGLLFVLLVGALAHAVRPTAISGQRDQATGHLL